MAKTKVKSDEHGLFVRAGGILFRPIMPVGYQHVLQTGSSFKEGDEVSASHVGGSELGRVNSGDVKEVWFSHGTYYGSGKKTSELFKPSHRTWK
ncbi:hypothetical protein [Paenibacillus taichungensis]